MKRAEAEKLVGEHVEVWTSLNGVYVGTLLRVFGRPWRGAVLIDGVLRAATPWEAGRTGRQRRGLRPGQEIEAGGANIRPTEDEGTTYLAALERQLREFERHAESAQDRDRGWIDHSLQEIRDRIAEEPAHLAQICADKGRYS